MRLRFDKTEGLVLRVEAAIRLCVKYAQFAEVIVCTFDIVIGQISLYNNSITTRSD